MSLHCIENADLAACAKAQGWPAGPQITSGEGSPEGVVTGYWVADQYWDTTNEILYSFNGDPGTNTNWVAIGP